MRKIRKAILATFPFILSIFCLSFVSLNINRVKPVEAITVDGTCGGGVTWKLDGDSIYIGGSGAMTDYKSYDETPWGKLIDDDNVKRIIINEGVTHIGSYAFCSCEEVKDFGIPDSVKSVGKYAFYDLGDNLDGYLVFGSRNFSWVDDYAFKWAKILGQVEMRYNWSRLGESAFESSYVSSVYISEPSSSYYWGEDAFCNCDRLIDVTFAEGVKTVREGAFSDCDALEAIEFATSITFVEEDAFEDCPESATIYLRNDLYSIDFDDGNYTVEYGHVVKNFHPRFMDGNNLRVECTNPNLYRYLTPGCTLNGNYWVARHRLMYIFETLYVTESSTLVLLNDTTTIVHGGVVISSNYKSLTICSQIVELLDFQGMGTLETWNVADNNAGIGGGDHIDGISVTINGGYIYSNGGLKGAGIGSGYYGDFCYVTINNGRVVSRGGDYGCGIGGSQNGYCHVTINGGRVYAYGGKEHYHAIGSIGRGSDIIINGGEVDAEGGGSGGIGIGGPNFTNIWINGGTINAIGGSDTYGIGSNDSWTGGINISLNGGKIKATGGKGGIGAFGKMEITKGNAVIEGTIQGTGTFMSDGSLTILLGIVAGVFAITAGVFMYLYFKKRKQETN